MKKNHCFVGKQWFCVEIIIFLFGATLLLGVNLGLVAVGPLVEPQFEMGVSGGCESRSVGVVFGVEMVASLPPVGHAVAVGILETLGVDLVENRGFPPAMLALIQNDMTHNVSSKFLG